jgi:dTDP-L-rhamnose 4-epimerase
MPPQPASLYAATKLAQERAVAALASRCGVAAVALRLQNVYGPGQDGSNPHAGVVAALARGILQDRSVELFEDGEMSRDFVHVDDVVRALRWAIEFDGAMPDVLNVGTGRRTPLRRLAELIDAHAGGGADIHCSGRLRAGDIRHAAADTTAWSAAFGSWTPVTLDGAMPAYLDWLAAQRVAASQP